MCIFSLSAKSVVGCKDFGTLKNPAIQENALASTNKIAIDLHWDTTSIFYTKSHISGPVVLSPLDFLSSEGNYYLHFW